MTNRKPKKTVLVIATIIALSIGLVKGARYAFWRIIEYKLVSDEVAAAACTSRETMTIPDLAGVKVEVVYSTCYKTEESALVYFSRAAVKEGSWFAKWRSHRTLVLTYGPDSRSLAGMPLPSVTRPAPSTILISVPEACDLWYTSGRWENMSISYVVGKVHR